MDKKQKDAVAPKPAVAFGAQKPRFVSGDVWRLARPVEREVLAAFASKKGEIRLEAVQTDATKRTVQLAFKNLIDAGVLVRVSRGLYGLA